MKVDPVYDLESPDPVLGAFFFIDNCLYNSNHFRGGIDDNEKGNACRINTSRTEVQ